MPDTSSAAEVDVIVVGAGVAGLSAAAALRSLGHTCMVLEASARAGGRAWTDTPAALGYAPFDRGASWLHAADRNPLVDLARAHGDPVRDSEPDRVRRVYVGERLANAAELAAYETAWERFEQLARARAAVEPDIAFAEAIAPLRDDPWIGTIETFEARMIAAADPEKFSLRDWQVNELNGGNMLVDGGIGAFVQRRLLPPAGEVRLNTPVSRLDWGGPIAAETPRGTLKAHAAIVTVSTGVLTARKIRFDPPLPPAFTESLHALPMGLLNKVALPAPPGERLGIPLRCSLHRQVALGEPAMFFHAWPSGRDYIAGFVGGPAAWELSLAGPAAAGAFARAEFRRLLGADAERKLGQAVVADWGSDPAHLGAYAYARPGHFAARATLGQPLADGRLIFAGEATRTDGLAGTVGGAWLAGRDAARLVATQLSRSRIET